MGLDLTGITTTIQGLIVQDSRLVAANIDPGPTLTTATQAQPRPGRPQQQQDTDLVLESVGTQSADKALRIRTHRSGHPGTDQATTIWQYDGDSLWRGWDPPVTISDFEFIDYSASLNAYRFPHAVRVPEVRTSGGQVVSGGYIVVAVQEGANTIASWTRNPADGTWSRTAIYTGGTRPCLLRLPSGRILCFFWRTSSGLATVRMFYTDDEGSSWTLGQEECLPAPFDTSAYATRRLRAAYLQGQVSLIAEVYASAASTKHQLWQYASDDLGATFSRIDILSTGNSRTVPDMVTYRDSSIVVAYVSTDGSANRRPYVRTLGSVYELLSSADATDVSEGSMQWGTEGGGAYSEAELALAVDEDDSLYLIGLDHTSGGGTAREIAALRSTDGGTAWGVLGSSSAPTSGIAMWYGRDASYHPDDYCFVCWRGCGVLIHGAQADGQEASIDVSESLMATFFGGHTTVCMPANTAIQAHRVTNRTGFEYTWLPWVSPDDLFFTLTQSTPNPTLVAGVRGRGVNHSDVAHFAYWSTAISTGLSNGGLHLVEVYHAGNNSLQSEIILQISDGGGPATSYTLIVLVTGTSIAVYDAPAGAGGGTLIASVSTTAAADSGVQILMGLQNDDGAAWWRARGPTDRAFSLIGSKDNMTAGTLTGALVRFGTRSGQASGTAWYKLACATDSTFCGVHLGPGQTNPDDLLGRAIMPTPVYVDDGLSVYAADGPTYTPDTWHVDTDYVYKLANTDPRAVPTPQLGHRTLNDDADADIVWDVGLASGDNHRLNGDVWAIYLGECNWRSAELWGREGSTWFKIGDIDMAEGMTGLGFNRYGASVVPKLDSGSSADRYLMEHILAGSTWDYGEGTPRKIRTNRSGTWTLDATATTHPTRLQLESYDPADSALGTSGAIWSKDAVVVVPTVQAFSAFRIRIKAQTTADGDLRTGVILFGRLLAFGSPYSMGRSLGVDPNYTLTEGRNGIRRVRRLGRERRSVEFDWTDGVFMNCLHNSPPDPNYFANHGGGPTLATVEDIPWTMQGAFERAAGAVDPVCYLARVDLSSSLQMITDRARFLYGRMVGESSRLDIAEGNEFSGRTERPEYVRVNTLRVEEEV